MNKMILKTGCLIILLFIAFANHGQETVEVPYVTGTAVIEGDEAKAKKEAKQNAYIKALKKAGVPVHMNVLQTQISEYSNEKLSQQYMEDINSELRGNVIPKEIIDTSKSINNAGMPIYKYTFNAEVAKYNPASDPNFNVSISGVERIYKEGDTDVFKIKPSKDCYLTLFNVAEKAVPHRYHSKYEQ